MGRPSIGFQGEHGAYSEEAIYKQFGREVKTVPAVSIHEVFNLTEAGAVDLGVVPIENSIEGSINETYDMLLSSNLAVVGEVVLRVVHCLIALRTAHLAGIKVVYSHPQALAQCRNFVESLGVEPRVTYDTAGSVKMIVAQGSSDAAAVAGRAAAAAYGAHIVARNIEDDRENFTRFLLISRTARQRPGANKTSIVFTTKNVPGALFRCLATFALRDINLTKIESRPWRGRPWEYLFYLDFLGRPEATPGRQALSHLAELTSFLRVLGCYPRSRPR